MRIKIFLRITKARRTSAAPSWVDIDKGELFQVSFMCKASVKVNNSPLYAVLVALTGDEATRLYCDLCR